MIFINVKFKLQHEGFLIQFDYQLVQIISVVFAIEKKIIFSIVI